MKKLYEYINEALTAKNTVIKSLLKSNLNKITGVDILDVIFEKIQRVNKEGTHKWDEYKNKSKSDRDRWGRKTTERDYFLSIDNPNVKDYYKMYEYDFNAFAKTAPNDKKYDSLLEDVGKEIDEVLKKVKEDYKKIFSTDNCEVELVITSDKWNPIQLLFKSKEYLKEYDLYKKEEDIKRNKEIEEYEKWAHDHPEKVAHNMGYGNGKWNGD